VACLLPVLPGRPPWRRWTSLERFRTAPALPGRPTAGRDGGGEAGSIRVLVIHGFLMDVCVWIGVERGILAPPMWKLTRGEPVFISPVTRGVPE